MRKTIIIATIALFIGLGTTSCVTTRPPHGPHPKHVNHKPPKPPKKKKHKHPKPPKRTNRHTDTGTDSSRRLYGQTVAAQQGALCSKAYGSKPHRIQQAPDLDIGRGLDAYSQ